MAYTFIDGCMLHSQMTDDVGSIHQILCLLHDSVRDGKQIMSFCNDLDRKSVK